MSEEDDELPDQRQHFEADLQEHSRHRIRAFFGYVAALLSDVLPASETPAGETDRVVDGPLANSSGVGFRNAKLDRTDEAGGFA